MLNKNLKLNFKGTTTVGIVYNKGVILAADRRVSDAYSKKIAHKHGKKILQIDDYIVATIAGAVADAQFIIDRLRMQARLYKLNTNRYIPVKSLANFASLILFNSRIFPYLTEINLGGYDDKGSSLYTVDLFGSLTSEKYIARGSGSPYAMGVLEAKYNQNINLEEGVKLVIEAIKSAINWDLYTGEGIDVVYINKEGVKFLEDKEIFEIAKKLYK